MVWSCVQKAPDGLIPPLSTFQREALCKVTREQCSLLGMSSSHVKHKEKLQLSPDQVP